MDDREVDEYECSVWASADRNRGKLCGACQVMPTLSGGATSWSVYEHLLTSTVGNSVEFARSCQPFQEAQHLGFYFPCRWYEAAGAPIQLLEVNIVSRFERSSAYRFLTPAIHMHQFPVLIDLADQRVTQSECDWLRLSTTI